MLIDLYSNCGLKNKIATTREKQTQQTSLNIQFGTKTALLLFFSYHPIKYRI